MAAPQANRHRGWETVGAYDAVVVGLGVYGSAVLDALAARGVRALGVDRFAPPHDRGSSHGATRIIRQAYFEDPAYVPLVLRAYTLWDELAAETGRRLLVRTGGLMVGPRHGTVVEGSARSARQHGLAHELLDAAEVVRRFPQLRLREGEVALYEPHAGVLAAEPCIEALLWRAQRRGAQVLFGTAVRSFRRSGGAVRVEADDGAWEATWLVLAAGPWLPQLVPELRSVLWVERQVPCWFPPRDPDLFAPGRMPVFILERGQGDPPLYGVPPLQGEGVKVAFHHGGGRVDPDGVAREVTPAELEPLRAEVAGRLPGLVPEPLRATVCLYTNAPDEHFLLGPHPEAHGVFIVSCCSGHGFKFAPAVGEAVADWLLTGRPPALLAGTPFDLRRAWPTGGGCSRPGGAGGR